MSTQVSFWKRLSSVFRTEMPSSRGGDGPLLGAVGAPDGEDRPLMRWLRGSGRSSRRERANAMMHLLEQHLQQQDQRAAQLSASVDRVAGMLEQIANSQRSQTDVLRTIADQVERSSGHAAAAAQSISQIPASMKAQADALHIVIDEMQQNRTQGSELVQSLRRVGDVVEGVQTVTAAQSETLRRMHDGNEQHREAVSKLVRDQSGRISLVFTVAALLGFVAITALAVTLVVTLAR